jgi:mannitol-1-phosphate 5-dehydrogenase
MSAPICLVIGSGRMAGGFVVPLLHANGWQVTIVARDPVVREAINAGGVRVHIGDAPTEQHIQFVNAIGDAEQDLSAVAADADMLVTAVGPDALMSVGERLAPAVQRRLAQRGTPLNIITFENHRRATERLAAGLITSEPELATEIGVRLGIAGCAVWRTISRREVRADGVVYAANAEDTCYVDTLSLVHGHAPHDARVDGIRLVTSFDDRMVEKLWTFNAGHCAAAYLGWAAGCQTLDEALSIPLVRDMVEGVVREACQGFAAYLASRPGSQPIATLATDEILAHYSDPTLNDTVVRVARDPRRKLAREDRLIGPALACIGAGIRPDALAIATAAALAYAEASDTQACDVQREIDLLGPEEVLCAIAHLSPGEEFIRLVSDAYRSRAFAPAGVLQR